MTTRRARVETGLTKNAILIFQVAGGGYFYIWVRCPDRTALLSTFKQDQWFRVADDFMKEHQNYDYITQLPFSLTHNLRRDS